MQHEEHENRMLVTGAFGYVAQCQHCKSIQLVIGNVRSELSVAGLKKLCTSFKRIRKGYYHRMVATPAGPRLILGTGADHLQLILTEKQFLATVDMLADAVIELSLREELKKIF